MLNFRILLLLCAFVVTAKAQLVGTILLPHPGDTSQEHYAAIGCSDDHNCTVIAIAGYGPYHFYFERTNDGGLTWTKQAAPIADEHDLFEKRYRRIFAIDSLHAIAIGDSGLIAHTSDAGQTWIDASIPTSFRLASASFSGISHGVIGDRAGILWVTSNSGAEWHRTEIPSTIFPGSVHLFDSSRLAVMPNGNGPIYFLDLNQGTIDSSSRMWDYKDDVNRSRAVGTLIWKSEFEAFGFGFYQPQIGNPTEWPLVIRTTNRGTSWDFVSDTVHFIEGSFTDVSFSDNAGLLVANDMRDIMYTTSGGITWERIYTAETGDIGFRSVAMLNSTTALAITDGVFGGPSRVLQFDLAKMRVESGALDIIYGTHIYPNPANDKISLLTTYTFDGHVTITDQLGRIAQTSDVSPTPSTSTIDCSSLPSGVYSATVNYHGRNLRAARFVIIRK